MGNKERNKGETPSPESVNALGFAWKDLQSWSGFVKLLHSPRDPSSLGATRIIFGFLMLVDIFEERGLSNAETRWGDPDQCTFPLFSFLIPPSLAWMYVLYLAMATGAIGVMLGVLYRCSCLLFLSTYWYLFLLDKSSWNNHSYLYGLVAFILLFCDANRWGSGDGLLWSSIKNQHVPLWNYTLLRAQFFLVYFIAGLKKLDQDWVEGYSMQKLSGHWVFSPLTPLLSHEDIDLWVVHRGGLVIDLTMGYLLLFDFTRPLAVLIAGSFHLMNSQLFAIGMFPYVMLGTLPLFSYVTWPKSLILALPASVQKCLASTAEPAPSNKCVYPVLTQAKKAKSNKSVKSPDSSSASSSVQLSPSHHIKSVLVLLYIALQCFVPYSHFITKGYNNWTPGLYGYSWDMMVHNWNPQHIRIRYVVKETGRDGYINPDAWLHSGKRWSMHADMTKQYATCIADRMRAYNLTDIELYFDVWVSLNDRFQQRMFNPHTDILSADWHPLKQTEWIMPLLLDLSDWRSQLDEIEADIYSRSNDTDVVFIADFPGLALESYLQPELGNASITVLKGSVLVEMETGNHTLLTGESIELLNGTYHSVHTISATPACYMYQYVNSTEIQLHQDITQYEQDREDTDNDAASTKPPASASVEQMYDEVKRKQQEVQQAIQQTTWNNLVHFAARKYKSVVRSLALSRVAVESIVTGESFEAVFNATIGKEPKEEL